MTIPFNYLKKTQAFPHLRRQRSTLKWNLLIPHRVLKYLNLNWTQKNEENRIFLNTHTAQSPVQLETHSPVQLETHQSSRKQKRGEYELEPRRSCRPIKRSEKAQIFFSEIEQNNDAHRKRRARNTLSQQIRRSQLTEDELESERLRNTEAHRKRRNTRSEEELESERLRNSEADRKRRNTRSEHRIAEDRARNTLLNKSEEVNSVKKVWKANELRMLCHIKDWENLFDKEIISRSRTKIFILKLYHHIPVVQWTHSARVVAQEISLMKDLLIRNSIVVVEKVQNQLWMFLIRAL